MPSMQLQKMSFDHVYAFWKGVQKLSFGGMLQELRMLFSVMSLIVYFEDHFLIFFSIFDFDKK